MVYMRYRRFLPKNHKYRKMGCYFDGAVEKDSAPKPYTGKLLFEMVKNIKDVFGKGTIKGKKRKRTTSTVLLLFKKYLPYWKDLEMCHSIDLMHVTKNVFDSIIGTLLDIPRKTKDGLKSRRDLEFFYWRKELHSEDRPNGKHYLPPASCSLTLEEKKALCKCFHGLKVPTGFSSNIRKLVSMKDLTLFGYNSHDCHMMMMVFLAIATRAIRPVHMKVVITQLCYFFNSVSQKVIARGDLDHLKTYIIETMCKLEMCFPPSFFDMQVHLMIHLVDQIHALGPLYVHHMFPYE